MATRISKGDLTQHRHSCSATRFRRRPGWLRTAAVVGLCILAGGCRATTSNPAAIQDALTAARVKTALVNDPDVGSYVIEVRVTAGVARLSGRVQAQAHAERAVALARAVPGVAAVETALQVDGAALPATRRDDPRLPARDAAAIAAFEPQPNRNLLAIGGSLGWSAPHAAALRSRTSFGPLIRIGSGTGLGAAIAFDWFKAEIAAGGAGARLARVHVKPVMGGLSYTVRTDRISIAPSIVAGYAFNSISISDSGAPAGALAVDISDSVVWRPGASIWFDPGGRFAINLSGGYLMTEFDLTVLDGGQLSTRPTRGDALLLHAGVAYKLF